jgi:hypothetical protein
MASVLITGNTYPVKDALKALGGKWDPKTKGWRVPTEKAAEATKLVAAAGVPRAPLSPDALRGVASSSDAIRGRWSGCRCGSIDGRPRASDCAQCAYDNE